MAARCSSSWATGRSRCSRSRKRTATVAAYAVRRSKPPANSARSVAALNYPIGETVERFHFGVALHVGKILYGNIGGGNRLDFTCIGPAVNLAARLEKIAGRLNRTIVASEGFAGICSGGWAELGEFPIAGFTRAERVYGLVDETPGPDRAADPSLTDAKSEIDHAEDDDRGSDPQAASREFAGRREQADAAVRCVRRRRSAASRAATVALQNLPGLVNWSNAMPSSPLNVAARAAPISRRPNGKRNRDHR